MYVERGGVYFDVPGVDPWDETRDARLYDGPWPVVAHPPCARWCQLAPMVEKLCGYAIGDDGGCFEAALRAVRTFGGVLEHPAHSLAWARYGLAEPLMDGWNLTLDGGAVAYVEQDRYGHPARKPTWLYAYGCDLPALRFGRRPPEKDEPGWWVRADKPHERRRGAHRLRGSRASATTPDFRDELLRIASSPLQFPCPSTPRPSVSPAGGEPQAREGDEGEATGHSSGVCPAASS